jgi:hypothetical protein
MLPYDDHAHKRYASSPGHSIHVLDLRAWMRGGGILVCGERVVAARELTYNLAPSQTKQAQSNHYPSDI